MTKYFSTSLLSLIVLFLSFGTLAQKEYKIAFYNVENLFDTLDTPDKDDKEYLPNAKKEWNSARYTEKLTHINTVLDLVGPSLIIGMCEIENEAVVRDVINAGSMKSSHGVVHFESLDARGIDNALIYDSTILKLKDSGFIRFKMPGSSSPSRDIIWAKFQYGEEVILAMVNHWPSRSGGQIESEPKRLVAANAARSFIDSVQNVDSGIKIVFIGDLNDYPDNLAPQMISSVLTPMITTKSGEYGGSYNYRGDWDVLDHIMVSKSFLKKKNIYVKKKSGKIHSAEFLLQTYKGDIVPFRTYGGSKYLGGYSDHLPVTVVIAF